jgi:hypothetical protein
MVPEQEKRYAYLCPACETERLKVTSVNGADTQSAGEQRNRFSPIKATARGKLSAIWLILIDAGLGLIR